ncbi:hypothetical protein [Nocardioides speluncae]|uniref:hypothetical protein n=1 Tax=Nocardioides speluncae TaxID=2670337 RepID=UPI000D69C40D|nr:hypothetical protein [Nocardioides speluncae]
MSDYYDASATSGQPQRPVLDLEGLADQAMERELLDFLEDLDEKLAQAEAAEADEPLTDEQVQGLVAVCSDEGAPLAFKSIKARVDDGRTTWAEVWHNLGDEGQTGLELMSAVLAWTAAQLPTWHAESESEVELAVEEGRLDDLGRAGGRAPKRDDEKG